LIHDCDQELFTPSQVEPKEFEALPVPVESCVEWCGEGGGERMRKVRERKREREGKGEE
jgi:hypothetical protein